MTPYFDTIVPHPDDYADDEELELIHERTYVVRAYRRGLHTLVLRGAVRDQKPPGLYVDHDPDPLTMHHMLVDLRVAVPSLTIESVDVSLEVHPHTQCPRIEESYQSLVGLSIGRGFINKVRELFGGPRGCTHTTALLQAMAPVAIQSMWSFRMAEAMADGSAVPFGSPESRARNLAVNLNTCHVWAEGSELVEAARNGEAMEQPVWLRSRLEKLGLDPDTYVRP